MSSKAPRFTRTLSRTPAPIDPLAGAAEAELASELEAFSERRGAELNRLAEEAGFLEGQQAAAEGGAADRSELTVRGRAFNRGVLISQQAALQTDIRDSVERFELENERDPDAFDSKVEGLLDGLIAEANPRLQSFIRQRAADYAGRSKTRIIARQQAQLLKEAGNDLIRGAEGLFDDATTAAFEGDVPMIEARRQELMQLLEFGVEGELIEEGAAAELAESFERQVTAQEVIGNFDRLVREKGTDAGVDAIAKWQKVKPSSVGLTADDHASVTRQLVALRNRQSSLTADEAAKSAATIRAETNLRRGRIADIIKAMKDGFSPDKKQTEQAAADIAFLSTSGEADDIQQAQELATDFDIAGAIQSQVHRFRRSSAKVRSDDIIELESALRSSGFKDPAEVELLKALKKTDADVNRELDTDPRGYLQREGLVEDPPLDFTGAEELIGSMAARKTDVGTQMVGEPIGKLSAAEADQFAQIFEQAEIEEKVALLGVITSGSGAAAAATLEQIDSKGHEQLALLGGYVMQGRSLLAREILRGQTILAATPAMKPLRTDYQPDIDNVWAGAMTEEPVLVERRALFLDATFAKYAELKARTGDLSDGYEPKLLRQALDAVMPTARYNGRRVAVPAGVTEDRFEEWTDSWDVETFTQFLAGDETENVLAAAAPDPEMIRPSDGTPMAVPGVTAEEMLRLVRDDGRLVELGNGRYGVKIVSAATGLGRGLTNGDGTPVVLQFPRPAE